MFLAASKTRGAQLLALSLLSVLLLTLSAPFTHQRIRDVLISRLRSRALLSDDAMLQQIAESSNFVYFPTIDVLMAHLAKGGSTSLFQWLYSGITGHDGYSKPDCGTHVQNPYSPCWNSQVVYLSDMTRSEQRHALTSPTTLRIAIQRNPFDRIISAFTDKYDCHSVFHESKPLMTIILRKRAALPARNESCMTISEFADALDRVRESNLPLQKLDVHIRPQQLFFEHIAYDIVLDVTELSNMSLLKPVWERLPFGEGVRDGVGHLHALDREPLMIPEAAAKKLFRFATESRMGERRYML